MLSRQVAHNADTRIVAVCDPFMKLLHRLSCVVQQGYRRADFAAEQQQIRKIAHQLFHLGEIRIAEKGRHVDAQSWLGKSFTNRQRKQRQEQRAERQMMLTCAGVKGEAGFAVKRQG